MAKEKVIYSPKINNPHYPLIKKMVEKRISYRDIGKVFGISYQRVHQIFTGYKSPSSQGSPALFIEAKPLNGIKIIQGDITKQTGIKEGSRDRIRELVRIRDKHTCQICLKVWKKGNRRFDVHHLNDEIEGNSYKMTVDISDRNQTDKMITLCHRCHLNLDSVKKKMAKAYWKSAVHNS